MYTPNDPQSMEVIHRLENLMADSPASTHPYRHSTNTMQRRSMARVVKPSSAGSSPQNYQRRRHTTSQTIPRQRRALYQQCLQTPPSAQLFSAARPVSWHPSTIIASQQTIPLYMTTYAHGIPTPMTTTSTSWYSPEDPSEFYQESSDYHLYRNSDVDMMQGGYHQQQPSAVFSPVVYPSALPTSTYTAPATPDLIPPPVESSPQQSLLPRTQSKELIGMGLYDDVSDRSSWTLDNYMTNDHTTRPISFGKGLKLEETWEPPEEEDKTDDEEEDVEEEAGLSLQEQLERVTREAPQLPPMTMSNQSFFFDTTPTPFTMTSYGMSF